MRRKPYWLVLLLTVAISPVLAVPVGADTSGGSSQELLTGPNDGPPEDIAVAYFQDNAADYSLSDTDVAEVVVRSSNVSRHTGATHVHINQQFDGLEVFGADTTITIAQDGTVAFVGGQSVGNLAIAAGVRSATGSLDVGDAVAAAAEVLNLGEPEQMRTLRRRGGAAQESVVTADETSDEPIDARRGWQATASGLRPAWRLLIADPGEPHLWDATIDAESGDLLELEDWSSDNSIDDLIMRLSRHDVATRTASVADSGPIITPDPFEDGSSYRVYALPTESPNDRDRALVTNPADAPSSPLGWHTVTEGAEPEYTILRGNNVDAFLDQDGNDQPDPGFEVDGGPDLTFDHPVDLTEHAQNYTEAVVTNLFYWNNITHDLFYRYGFDEESGNFQDNKFGALTLDGTPVPGGDHIRAMAADGQGTNNANFRSPPWGSAIFPRMRMYLWPGNQFGFQNQVVVDGVGEFNARWARFAAAPTNAGIPGRTFVDAGNGCSADQYPDDLPSGGWIALVDGVTGGAGCTHVVRGQVAQAQGADGLVVANPGGGAAQILSGTITEPRVVIPVASITQADANTIRAAIADGGATGDVRKHPNHPGIRDGDLEAGIILHEYSHGISIRLTGGPANNCLGGQQQAGEGWSDYHGIATLLDPTLDDPEEARGMGPYALFQDSRNDNGIRPRPYSRNMEIQPATYESIRTGGWLNGGSVSQPHGIGHVFAAFLWDMTWDLIDKHGFNPQVYDDWSTGGNILAQQLVMDGLKIQGCSPSFVVARDAIITADQLLTGGDNQCTLWASFARRGLGFSATSASTARNAATEAFDTHPGCREDFQAPVHGDYGELNTVVAGDVRPLRFNLGSNQGLDILASNSPFSRQVDCDTLAVVSENPPFTTPRARPVATETPGNSGLSVSGRGVYTYPWETLEEWAGTCRELVLTRTDGVQHRAFFEFTED